MKKGTVLEGIVNKIQFPNKGIVEVDGEKAIVKNALPGQNVRFVLNKSRKGKGEGRLLEVLERSPREWDKESWKEQVCPHFEICGGCLYQSLPYEEQLKIKEEQVKELIDSVCANPEYEFQGIKASPLYQGYRNKMEFSFGDEYKGGPLSLGCIKGEAFMILYPPRNAALFTRISGSFWWQQKSIFLKKALIFIKSWPIQDICAISWFAGP